MAHDALRERELANKVEAKALKNLARLSSMDLTQEQKNSAYDLLYKAAEDESGESSPAPVESGNGPGNQFDAEDLTVAGLIRMAGSESSKKPLVLNSGQILEGGGEGESEEINKEIGVLRPVLNETQIEEYRRRLESTSRQTYIHNSFYFDPERKTAVLVLSMPVQETEE